MSRLDRYVLMATLSAFAFFLLVFTGVIWLTQAVQVIETVIASGRGGATFLTFSLLVLPQVFAIVLPLASIGAVLYALNKLYGESELVVLMISGFGPRGILRALAVFGTLVAALMAVVLTQGIPRANAELGARTQAIRSDLAQSLIVERQFIHPLDGITLFISDTSRTGEMAGIFLNDQRDPDRIVTYSAEQALLLRDGDQARLVMADGVALTVAQNGRSLNSVAFDQFVFDLSALLDVEDARLPRPSQYRISELLAPTAEMLAGRYSLGDYISEAHYKISLPLLTLLYPLVAGITFLAGGYRRSGPGRRVFVAIFVAVLLQMGAVRSDTVVESRPDLWWVMYGPHAAALVYVAAMLSYLGRRRRPARGMRGMA